MKNHEVFLEVTPVPVGLVPMSPKIEKQLKWFIKTFTCVMIGISAILFLAIWHEVILNYLFLKAHPL